MGVEPTSPSMNDANTKSTSSGALLCACTIVHICMHTYTLFRKTWKDRMPSYSLPPPRPQPPQTKIILIGTYTFGSSIYYTVLVFGQILAFLCFSFEPRNYECGSEFRLVVCFPFSCNGITRDTSTIWGETCIYV